jgi:hypothetical protein
VLFRSEPQLRKCVAHDPLSQDRIHEDRVRLGVQRRAMPTLQFDQRRGVAQRKSIHQDGIGDDGGLRL